MSEYNQRLGISIPTFRRPEWLRVAVLSVIRAAKDDAIPIFLLDDSTDDTNTGVVDELQRSYPLIFHVRNEQNLGIDRNIIKSVQTCTTDFVWLLGEDDLLRGDSVETVLRVLGRGGQQPAFISVNYSLLNEDYSAILRERFMSIRKDDEVACNEFFRRWGWAVGFIGACVVNKGLWSRVDPTPYLDTYWAHVGVIMESIVGREVYMLAEPLVQTRMGSPRVFSWSGSTFEVVDGWERLGMKLVPVYGESTCREGIRKFERVFGLDGRFLIYARGEGLYDMEGFRERVVGKGRGPLKITVGWIIARLPRALARLMVRTSRRIRIFSQRMRGISKRVDHPVPLP